MSAEDKRNKYTPPTQQEIEHQLNTDPAILAWFEQFEAVSVKTFLATYPWTISWVMSWWPQEESYRNELPLQYIEKAEEMIWDIQQKKLFNFQCLFRAGKVRTPEIESLFDFDYWEDNIKICPFIEPITAQDVDLYKSFLLSSSNLKRRYRITDFQNYNEFKQARNEHTGGIMPEWYVYYDTMRGTGMLLNLPDQRGPMEDFYRALCIKNKQSFMDESQAKYEAENPVDTRDLRPWVNSMEEGLLAFAERFESKETVKLLKSYYRFHEEDYDYGEVMDEYYFLQTVEEPLSFEPHYDWRVQVLRTAHKYRSMKIAEAMDTVFENYQMRIQTGIGYPPEDDFITLPSGEIHKRRPYHNDFKNDILKGRELNGEPRDWDF